MSLITKFTRHQVSPASLDLELHYLHATAKPGGEQRVGEARAKETFLLSSRGASVIKDLRYCSRHISSMLRKHCIKPSSPRQATK